MSSLPDTFAALAAAICDTHGVPSRGGDAKAVAELLFDVGARLRADSITVRGIGPFAGVDEPYGRVRWLHGQTVFDQRFAFALAAPLVEAVSEATGIVPSTAGTSVRAAEDRTFRVWQMPGDDIRTEILAWGLSGAQLQAIPSPADAGFAPADAAWIESTFRDHGELLGKLVLLAAPTNEVLQRAVNVVLGLLDEPGIDPISMREPQVVSPPWSFQMVIGAQLSFGQAIRAALRQDPNVLVAAGPSLPQETDLVQNAALTGHAVVAGVVASSPQDALAQLRAHATMDLSHSLSDLLFVEERAGRLQLAKRLGRKDVAAALASLPS